MTFRLALVLPALALWLAGCVSNPPQKPIAVAPAVLNAKTTKVGVVMAPLPKVDTQFPGAACLLCLAVASSANSALTTHVQKLPNDDLVKLPADIAKLLRERGMDVVLLEQPLDIRNLPDAANKAPDFARKDFTALKAKYGVDKLLVLDIQTLGVSRNYANYVASGAPVAVLVGTGYLVNLSTNALEWHAPLNITKAADGNWDEPPKYPGLTNAYFQAVEAGRDSLTQPFAK